MTAPRAYKATAIVLRGRNLGEADRIYTLLTQERGKIDAIAKGVRRQKSSLGGRLEFMNELALTMHAGRSLDVITSADILRSHFDAIVQPETFSSAHMTAELIDAFVEPELAVPEIYALLHNVLRAFDRGNAQALLPRFQLRLLDALGIAPQSDACARCGASLIDAAAWVDLESAGLSGMECHQSWMHALELQHAEVANFRALAASRTEAGATLHALPVVAQAVDAFITYHLGRRPRTLLAQ